MASELASEVEAAQSRPPLSSVGHEATILTGLWIRHETSTAGVLPSSHHVEDRLLPSKHIPERADCCDGVEDALVEFEMEPGFKGPECAQKVRLMMRGRKVGRAHAFDSLWALRSSTCRAYF